MIDDGAGQQGRGTPAGGEVGFRLLRQYTLATLLAFAAVAVALVLLQRGEESYFAQVQREQAAFFAQAQAELARQHEDAARRSLLALHESSHVNLTRLMANTLWASDIAPFVAAAQRLAVQPCRQLTEAAERQDCQTRIGSRLMAWPGFQALDRKVYTALRESTVFKVKVFDTRGVTVYSSEQRQIGEDAHPNAGWQRAAAGQPASELTHRDRFSAFERVVEDRDLISTYVPVRAVGAGPVVGVFELYSDVTPFLQQTRAAARQFAEITAANQAHAVQAADAALDKVVDTSNRFLWIVGALLALLYVVSLLIVRHGQRIIDAQRQAQHQAAQRERLWHREKMAALATMAANIAHEVGNPLAVVAGVAALLPEIPGQEGAARQILAQTQRIARMTRQIADFASARGGGPEWLDVNARVKAVCDFLSFDLRLRGTPIDFQPGADLPVREMVADDIDELTMNLVQAQADGAAQFAPGARLLVQTEVRGADLVLRAGLDAGVPVDWPPQARLDALARRARDVGALLQQVDHVVELVMPATWAAPGPGADQPVWCQSASVLRSRSHPVRGAARRLLSALTLRRSIKGIR